jgi:hypothetical protein
VAVLTHTTKADRREENQRRLPIGSIYFENMAGHVGDTPQEDSHDHTLQLGISHENRNMARPTL